MTSKPHISQPMVDGVADKVWRIENLIDEAISLSADLTSEVTRTRLDCGLSATVGHRQIVSHLPVILEGLVSARGGAVEVHNGLAVFARSRHLVTSSAPPPKEDQPSFEPMGRLVELPAARAA